MVSQERFVVSSVRQTQRGHSTTTNKGIYGAFSQETHWRVFVVAQILGNLSIARGSDVSGIRDADVEQKER